MDHGDGEDESRAAGPRSGPARDLEEPRDGGDRGLAPAARAVVREHLGHERGPAAGERRRPGSLPVATADAEERREAADPRDGEDRRGERASRRRPSRAVDEERRRPAGATRTIASTAATTAPPGTRSAPRTSASGDASGPGAGTRPRGARVVERRAAEARGRMRHQNEAEGRRRRGQAAASAAPRTAEKARLIRHVREEAPGTGRA